MTLLARFKRRTSVFTIIAFALSVLFAISSPSLAFASAGLVRLSSDVYTNGSSQHNTEVEPDTYSFGSTIVSAFQVGRFYDGGSSNIGWATSKNSGKTWTHGFLPGTTVYAEGTYDRVSDASVAYDAAHHTWMISSLAVSLTTGNSVIVSRSSNGGLTWTKPVVVKAGGSADFFDKEWIVCDDTASSRFYGHCYVEWDNANRNGIILMSTSTDGGATWGSPKSPANQSFFGVGGQPLVQPGGTVIVPILGFDFRTGGPNIESFTSTDGGTSWNSAVTVSSAIPFIEHASIRSGPLPSAEIDGSGRVYVVWQDCRFEAGCSANDLVMSTSTDGVKWSAVRRIPTNPVGSGADNFIPGIAVDKSTSSATRILHTAY